AGGESSADFHRGLGHLMWPWGLDRACGLIRPPSTWQRASQPDGLASASETACQAVYIVTLHGMLVSCFGARGAGSGWRWPGVAGRRATAQRAVGWLLTAHVTACRVS